MSVINEIFGIAPESPAANPNMKIALLLRVLAEMLDEQQPATVEDAYAREIPVRVFSRAG